MGIFPKMTVYVLMCMAVQAQATKKEEPAIKQEELSREEEPDIKQEELSSEEEPAIKQEEQATQQTVNQYNPWEVLGGHKGFLKQHKSGRRGRKKVYFEISLFEG